MADYNYLIIGGGMASDAGAQGIRELDSGGTTRMIGVELDPPYNRPPLSKSVWKGKPLDIIWRKARERNVDLRLGRRAEAIDVQGKRITDDEGDTYTFDKLLLATGAGPAICHTAVT